MILWALVMFLSGLLAYIALPILVGPSLDVEKRQTLATVYWKQAMQMFRHAALFEKWPGNYTIYSVEPDEDWDADRLPFGEHNYVEDPLKRKSRLFKRPFGLVAAAFNCYVEPKDCELGKHHERHAEEGNHQPTVQVGDSAITAVNAHMPVPDALSFVNLHDVRGLLGKHAWPGLTSTRYDYTEKSQRGFDSRNVVEVMTLVIAFAVTFGIVVLAHSQLGGGGSVGGTTIPMMVEVMA